MAGISANSRIFIEPDNQYTTITIYSSDNISGETLIAPALNQTITAAFNKSRDDLASLLVGGVKVKQIIITMSAE